MEKSLHEELSRIHQMMKTNNIKISIKEETDPDELRFGQRKINALGEAKNKGDYQGFNNVPFWILAPKGGGEPEVWKMRPGMSYDELFPNSNIKYGTVVDAAKITHENQPYIDGDQGGKICLPDQSWLDFFGEKELVYKFKSPKTGKVYAIQMGLRDTSNFMYGPNQEKLSGIEAAIACYGGSNGWVIKANNISDKQFQEGRSPYKDINSDEYWSDNPEAGLFDIRSNDDIYWDETGIYYEIIIGVVIGIVTAGIGSAFAITSVLGRTLLIIAEIGVELGALMPKIMNSWERGMTVDAVMTTMFAFIPALFAIKPIGKFLGKGLGGLDVSEKTLASLLAKIKRAGGWEVIMTPGFFKTIDGKMFLESLTKAELEGFNVGMKMVDNLGNASEKELADLAKEVKKIVEKNWKNISKELRQKTYSWADKIAEDLAQYFVKNTSIAFGTGFVPSLARGFIVVTPIAMTIQIAGAYIKELITHSEEIAMEEAEKKTQEIIKTITEKWWGQSAYDFYTFQLHSMLYPQKTKEDFIELATEVYKNPENVDIKVQEKVMEYRERVDQEIQSNPSKLIQAEAIFLQEKRKNVSIIEEQLEKLGFTNILIDSTNKTLSDNWTIDMVFNGKKVKGVITFTKNTEGYHEIKITVDGVEIYPNLNKPISDILNKDKVVRVPPGYKEEKQNKFCCLGINKKYSECPKDEFDALPDNEKKLVKKEESCQ